MADLTSVQATVYGRVQGVFFRAFVAEQANELGLTGYVRNLHGEGVEVLAEGERRQLLFWNRLLIKNGEIVSEKRRRFLERV